MARDISDVCRIEEGNFVLECHAFRGEAVRPAILPEKLSLEHERQTLPLSYTFCFPVTEVRKYAALKPIEICCKECNETYVISREFLSALVNYPPQE